MRIRLHALPLVLAFPALLSASAAAAPGTTAPVPAPAVQRLITETDLLRFRWIADPQISPDGSRVVFVRVTVDDKGEGYETALWTVGTDGKEPARPLTHGPQDSRPRFSPDGRWVAFTRSSEKDGKRQPPQVWILPLAGGEAWALTSLPKGAAGPVWAPEGGRLAFLSSTTAEDLAKAGKQDGAAATSKKPAEDSEKPASDVHVITRAVYRANGEGYLELDRPSHIWVATLPGASLEKTPEPKPVTSGAFDEDEPTWSLDGKTIYFTSTRNLEPYYETTGDELWSVAVPPVDGSGAPDEVKEVKKIATLDGNLGDLSLSPDGKRMAFVGAPGKPVLSCRQPDLWVVDLAGGTPRNLTAALDVDVLGGLSGDQHPPRGGGQAPLLWSADGKTITLRVARAGRANLERIDVATGAASPFESGEHEVVSYSAARDGRIAATLSSPTSIGDLFLIDAAGKARRLSGVNDELFSRLDLSAPEMIWYPSFDGRKIQAWVQKPPHFDPSRKYPLILNIHGGPHAAYGFTFDHEFQWMAAQGYVVLYPNPRGSTTYGREFCNVIQYRYPGDDFKDLMAGVDELIHRGYVDPKQLAVTGGSGGGLLTDWVVGHTERFAAAAAQRDISDWANWWYTADFTLFQPAWFKAPPFQDPADYKARSPLTYVEKIKTPILFVDGLADFRTPPAAGGEPLFRALKYLKRKTVLVEFPGESHELSRSGKPWHRVERLRHIVGWFDKWLLGKAVPGYEVGEEGKSTAGRRD